ncbi:MAG: zf-HC2 domain-containing protein [Candidatus Methylomirabilis oxyfera]|nr:zf-HC2 domain-containing protein [Candidatus Methylomirabilis oxyfera]
MTRWARKPFRARATMLTCQEQVELLADYLDGILDPETASALERHLEDCPACLNFITTYKATSAWVREITYEEMPEELKERLTSFLRAKIRKQRAGGDH